MIEVENLSKFYGTFPAVRDVSFEVASGEILGFLGPNGAGKTTTMRMITGYIPPTAGKVRVAGFDVSEKSMQARAHLGYLPETVPLYTELTPYEYLDFKGRISGMHNSRERRARVAEVMDELNLTDVSSKLIGALSRGYRQRVGLAQAMLHNPDVLILDEPTVGLDPVQITEVRDLIRRLGETHTIILSTHLLPEVSMVCNRVIIINRGRLVALDTPFHLAADAGTPVLVVEAEGPSAEIVQVLRSIPAVNDVVIDGQLDGASGTATYQVHAADGTDVRSEISAAVVGGGYRLLELKSVRPSLEEIFLQVITQDQAEAEEYIPEEEEFDLDAEDLDGSGMDELDADREVTVAARTGSQGIRAKRRSRR